MPKFTRNFTAGRMNKVLDERIIPNGEYIDAMNVRMGSTENAEIGVIENTKGNLSLTTLKFNNTLLSVDARCIGAYEDGSLETIYWFVHDPSFSLGNTGKLDLIVSYNTNTFLLIYHVITIDNGVNGGGVNTTLNFNPQYLITGVNKIEDLLFFTDNYNAPRSINVNRNYAIPSGAPLIDAGSSAAALLLEESLLVIKKPPSESPTVQLVNTQGEQNFLEERFISFAYRYLYADGEYSATSQWSDIAFSPNGFELTVEAYLNEGMINAFNACQVTYYTGNSLVIGIDLLFKQSESNIIKVIVKQNKQDLGIANNIYTNIVFDNSKIFTVLPEAELLRLYDNVPRFAKAQTLMGNRLMYGNYIEGYDLVSLNNQPLQLTYVANLMQEEIGTETLTSTDETSVYDIDITSPNYSVPDSILRIDFASLALPTYASNLILGATIQIQLEFTHDSYTGGTQPTTQTANTSISSTFTLAANYTSPFALSQSIEFQEWVGTLINILPVYDPNPLTPTSCSGITFTDDFNCSIPTNQASGWEKRASGITAIDEPIKIIAVNTNTYIDLQLVAMQYEDINNLGTYAYEYYSILSSLVTFNKLGNARSLHSNRGYEIGIVYMDDFLRSSTALVSPLNSVYTPCSSSPNKNSIRVKIPVSQIAPYWATRYKFVIKPDQEGYQTIYSTLVVQDVDSLFWFLLEGENMQKVEVGDRLIVKKDSSGPTDECLYTTVLEKIAKQATGNFTVEGVYMRLEAGNFSSTVPPIPTISDLDEQESDVKDYITRVWNSWHDPVTLVNYDIPQGSVIELLFHTYRQSYGGCTKRETNAAQTYISFTANTSYNDLVGWWTANQSAIMSSITAMVAADNQNMGAPTFQGFYTHPSYPNCTGTGDSILIAIQTGASGEQSMKMCGTDACGFRKAWAKIGFRLIRSNVDPAFIFETLPIDALPDVFFENNLSFAINPTTGEHDGNVQNQDFALGQDAIIDTGFFNCFSFGNGVESYKVRDSIIGREFNLGERVTSVSAQDYKEAHRFSDITYSGIYNTETNLNKLNEFNLGLLNFKYLESSFGHIYILDGRETDVLCLQEDKISYVLEGKNLLSDAGAGRALTSVPEVLGTQIARTERFGISHNPESYIQWGADRYFTDVKRGAVIHLQGDSMQSDKLQVVSEFGMRTFFRDEFIDASTTQKLGGYDPYMNEYVLTTNDIEIPSIVDCIECGQVSTYSIDNTDKDEKVISYCIKLNDCIGLGNIVVTTTSMSSGSSIIININYDNYNNLTNKFETRVLADGGVFEAKSCLIAQLVSLNNNIITTVSTNTYSYNVNNPTVLQLEVVLTISADAIVVFDIDNQCQDCTPINLVQVVITDGVDAGMFIHNQYNYTDNTLLPIYSSPLQSNQVTFAFPSVNPLVSYYSIISGFQGQGSFPYPGVDMALYTNKFGIDDFDVTIPPIGPNKFLHYTSNTFYSNNQVDITTLLSLANNITPLTNPSLNQYKGVYNVTSLNSFLYLIWDLRKTFEVELCYSESNCADACADCYTPPPCNCGSWLVVNTNDHEFEGIGYIDCDGNNSIIGEYGSCGFVFPPFGALFICARDFPEDFREPTFTYIYLGCFCCQDQCVSFTIENTGGEDIVFLGTLDCNNSEIITVRIDALSTIQQCLTSFPTLCYFTIAQGINNIEDLDFTFNDCGCDDICCSTYYLFNPVETTSYSILDCDGNSSIQQLQSNNGIFVCAQSITSQEPSLLIENINNCNCCLECYTVNVTNGNTIPIDLTGVFICNDVRIATETIPAGSTVQLCVESLSNWEITPVGPGSFSGLLVAIEFVNCDCPL